MAKRLLPYCSGRGLRWPISTQCFSSSIAGDKDRLQRLRRLMLDGPNLNNFFQKIKELRYGPRYMTLLRISPRRVTSETGVKEVVLLGHNVNSYNDCSEISAASVAPVQSTENALDFKTVYKSKRCDRNFVTLLEKVSDVDPEIRIRFTSPHSKDFAIEFDNCSCRCDQIFVHILIPFGYQWAHEFEVINLIKERSNICNEVRLPAQSGSNRVLETMGRGYTKEAYLELVYRIRSIIPDVSLKSDFIAGFCGETETDHKETLELIQLIRYSFCYVFPYSMREKTRAKYRSKDDVLAETKQRRHLELTSVFRSVSLSFNQSLIGTYQLVLIESQSKRLSLSMVGRTDGGTKVVINRLNTDEGDQSIVGDYVVVQMN